VDILSLNLASKKYLKIRENGAQGRNRTTDTGIFSPLLYRLSYLGISRLYRREWPMQSSGKRVLNRDAAF
jgi:hypothetical protein